MTNDQKTEWFRNQIDTHAGYFTEAKIKAAVFHSKSSSVCSACLPVETFYLR